MNYMPSTNNKLSQIFNREAFLIFLFLFGTLGLYYSRAMLSMFTVGIFLFAILKNDPRSLWYRLKDNRQTLALSSIFLIYLFSGINSQDKGDWLIRLNSNLAYIFIPIGVMGLGPYSRLLFHKILYVFIGITTISALIILGDYVLHFTTYNDLYKQAQVLPTPIKHVRYSFYIALGALLGVYLLLEKSDVFGRISRQLTIVLTGLLFVFLHVLAVRTGLLFFYVSFLSLFTLYCIRLRSAAPLIGAVLLLTISGVIAYNTMPSVYNKVHYMRYDLNKRSDLKDRHLYSDVIRLASIKTGIDVGKAHPFIGTGIGDLSSEMKIAYSKEYNDFPTKSRFDPISQYIFTFAAFGTIGFIIFYGLFFYPFLSGGFRDYYLVLFYTGAAAIFFVESGIELQLGKVFFFTLLCLGFNHTKNRIADS